MTQAGRLDPSRYIGGRDDPCCGGEVGAECERDLVVRTVGALQVGSRPFSVRSAPVADSGASFLWAGQGIEPATLGLKIP